MKNKKFLIEVLILGFALFSTMFGAGNLIFPPQIGLLSGDRWFLGAMGLLLTGIVLPVMALWSISNVGYGAEDLMGHVHPKFYTLFYLVGGILIGVSSTLPRCAATTHEIGVSNIFPGVPIWVTVPIFFVLVYFFASDRNSVVDKLGKYLTPLLLILLAIVLIKGVLTPVGTPVSTELKNPFSSALLTAYNTGDLTVGILFAGVLIEQLRRKGYSGKQLKLGGFLGGIICVVALFAVYGTLTYLGGTASGIYSPDTPQTAILSGIIGLVMGKFGLGLMGCAVALACLTTAVGIGSCVVAFLADFFGGRISYKMLMLIVCVVGTVLGITGVQNLVNYVTPIFLVVYPVCIVMTFLGLLNRFVPNDGVYFGGVLFAGIASVGDAILAVNPNLEVVRSMVSALPFASHGFGWVVPALLGMVVFGILRRNTPKYEPAALEEAV